MLTAAIKRAFLVVIAVTALGLSGCAFLEGNEMSSDDARRQMETAVEAVQGATGENWEVEIDPGLASCSRTHGQWTTSWSATLTADRDASYASVREALEQAGFTTSLLGPNSRTPMVGAQTQEGFGLNFSVPELGGPIGLDVSSDCFPEEE